MNPPTNPTDDLDPPARLPAVVPPGAVAADGELRLVPGLIAAAGWRYVEFFTANIRNPNTRRAYARACGRFFAWCDGRGLTLTTIRPHDVATCIEERQRLIALTQDALNVVSRKGARVRHRMQRRRVFRISTDNIDESVCFGAHFERRGPAGFVGALGYKFGVPTTNRRT
jgi:hypothetical protein